MKTVYKYPIEVKGLQEVEMPQGSRILAVQFQDEMGGILGPLAVNNPCLWTLVNNDEGKKVRRLLRIYGTGEAINEPLESLNYIGTFQQGPFVWHVFERNVGKMRIRKGA